MEPRDFHPNSVIIYSVVSRFGMAALLPICGAVYLFLRAWQRESWSDAIVGAIVLLPLLLVIVMAVGQFTKRYIRIANDGISVPAGILGTLGIGGPTLLPYGEIKRIGTISEEATATQKRWGVNDRQTWVLIEMTSGTQYTIFANMYEDWQRMLDLLQRQGLRKGGVEKSEFLGTYYFAEEAK